METQYQRGKIQEESMNYEMRKHDGTHPIVGVNTFLNPSEGKDEVKELHLARATRKEKKQQITNLKLFQKRHEKQTGKALRQLQKAALKGDNIFEELMETVKVASLGQITNALYEVGGKYRRNM